ncbi:MAG: zinc-dependent metalloprotease [Acidimicrobiia bacterium]
MTSPIDWALAERVAIRMAKREPLADSYLAHSLAPDFEELTAQAEALVESSTGLSSSAGPARARVADRDGWIRANMASFQRLLRPLTDRLGEQLVSRKAGGAPLSLTQKLTALEVGALLGWMSARVLGQYDLLVVDDDTAHEQDLVYYVGPNVLSLEKRFGFPPREFRLWLALHEVTHRAQFTGVPWMREHYLSLIEQLLGSVDPDPQRFLAMVKNARDGRERIESGGIVAMFATPRQRELLDQIGGLMSLLEGHGDVTMDRAGQGHVPNAERFSRVLRERRKSAGGVTRTLQKLIGLEAKLAQYQQGEEFIAAIERVGGHQVIERAWQDPGALPTLVEIREPNRWLERVGVHPTAAAG